MTTCDACSHPIPDPATTAQALEHETPCAACNEAAQRGTYAPCATVEHSPWAADDDAEALAASASVLWPVLLRHANALRRARIAREQLTDDQLATAATRSGLVADPDRLPLNAVRNQSVTVAGMTWAEARARNAAMLRAEATDRQRELGDVWAGIMAARAAKTTHEARYYEDSDGFEEMMRGGPVTVGRTTVGAAFIRAPLYAAGIAATARTVR